MQKGQSGALTLIEKGNIKEEYWKMQLVKLLKS